MCIRDSKICSCMRARVVCVFILAYVEAFPNVVKGEINFHWKATLSQPLLIEAQIRMHSVDSVSYTHLDVYKRQILSNP